MTKQIIELSKIYEGSNQFDWPWVYAHGELELDNISYDKIGIQYIPDILTYDSIKPSEEGLYSARHNDRLVVIKLSYNRGIPKQLSGRACYVDDLEAMKHVMDDRAWR